MENNECSRPVLTFEGEYVENDRITAPNKPGPTTADLIRTLGLKPTTKERAKKEAER